MTRPKPKRPNTVSLPEFAAAIDVCEKTLREAIHRGEAPGLKVGSRIVVPRPAFDAYMRGEWVPTRDRLVSQLIEEVRIALAFDAKRQLRLER